MKSLLSDDDVLEAAWFQALKLIKKSNIEKERVTIGGDAFANGDQLKKKLSVIATSWESFSPRQ